MDNFRKINIDQYDEDVIQDEELVEPYPKAPEQALADAKAKSTEVRTLIGRCVTTILPAEQKGSTRPTYCWADRCTY